MLSIIIPTYNEAKIIKKTLTQFKNKPQNVEVILVDGGSTDKTLAIAKQFSNITILQSPTKGRANQMNYGASKAKGEILLFLHADTILPQDYYRFITQVTKKYLGGAFNIQFNDTSLVYKLINLYSNTRAKIFKMYHGDQAIFIKKNIFRKIGGYPNIPIMEDVKLSEAMRKEGKSILLHARVTTSERRIKKTGVCKSIAIYFLMKTRYKLGTSPIKLAQLYKKTKQ